MINLFFSSIWIIFLGSCVYSISLPLSYFKQYEEIDGRLVNYAGFTLNATVDGQDFICGLDFSAAYFDLISLEACNKTPIVTCDGIPECDVPSQLCYNSNASDVIEGVFEYRSNQCTKNCNDHKSNVTLYNSVVIDPFYTTVFSQNSIFPKSALICKIGISSITGTSENPLWNYITNTGGKYMAFDFSNKDSYININTGDNMMYFGDLPAQFSDKILWSNTRLKISSYSFSIASFIYDLTFCGESLLKGADGNMVIRVSSEEQCLVVPAPQYEKIVQLLPLNCSASALCEFSNSTDVVKKRVGDTLISFRLKQNGERLTMPLSSLIWRNSTETNPKLCISKMNENSYTKSIPEIIFGQKVLESFYVAFDIETKRLGLANKLFNGTYKSDNNLCQALNVDSEAELSKRCVDNGLRAYDQQSRLCDLKFGTKFIVYLLLLSIFSIEMYASITYDSKQKYLQNIEIKSLADSN